MNIFSRKVKFTVHRNVQWSNQDKSPGDTSTIYPTDPELRGHKSLQQDLISFLNTIFKNHNTEIAIETGPTPPSKACFKRLRLVRLGLQCNPPALNHQREKPISIFWIIGIHCYLGLFCIFCSIPIAKVFVPLYIHHNKTKFWILVFFHFTFICPLIKGQIKINKGKISKYIL